MSQTKVNFYLDANSDEHVDFHVKHLTKRLRMVADELQQNTLIIGYRDEELRPLNLDNVIRFYTKGNYVVAELKSETTYRVKQRIYQLNKVLPTKFIQISSGEIVNFNDVDHLELVGNGTIKLIFKDQEFTYVSRRYVPNIKRRLGI